MPKPKASKKVTSSLAGVDDLSSNVSAWLASKPSQEITDANIIPTGVWEIDNVLTRGQGGFAQGVRYELYGDPGSCKSALGYRILGNALRQHPESVVVLIDNELAYHPDIMSGWLKQLGLDPDQLRVLQPPNLDGTYRAMVEVMEKWPVSAIVWDSYAATSSEPTDPRELKKFREKAFGSRGKIAQGPRVNRQAMPDVCKACQQNNVLLVCINQVILSFGSTGRAYKDSPGGNPFHHAMDVRIRFSPRGDVYDGKIPVGRVIRAEVVKSRVFNGGASTGPDGDCDDFVFYFDGREGNQGENILALACTYGAVEQAGAYYKWRDYNISGKKNFLKAVEDDGLMDDLLEDAKTSMSAEETFEMPEFDDGEDDVVL